MAVYIKNGKAVIKDTRSKKRRREEAAKKRKTWAISPVTRTVRNAKAYDRKRLGRADDTE